MDAAAGIAARKDPMVFSSLLFLFGFLPLALALYFLVRKEYRNALLLLVSLFFYAWGEGFFVLALLFTIGVAYLAGLAMHRLRGRTGAKASLAAGVALSLAPLLLYKYGAFLVGNINPLIDLVGLPTLEVPRLLLPIGISFFTFQAISYMADVYRGDAKTERNPARIALYVSSFPQLIAGPIVRYRDVAGQIASRQVTVDGFAEGVKRFTLGLGKKVLIANTLAGVADPIFALPAQDLTSGLAWLATMSYTLQLYFDFSGYSDMAVGLGRMFGFTFMENFRYPYVSKSIREFWTRWHISLSTWFRDYLYFPLGGNRRGTARTYANLLVVFFLCGLWHGATWNFVLWGMWNGLFLALERGRFGRFLEQRWTPARHFYALVVMVSGFVLVRTETLSAAFLHLSAMLGGAEGAGSLYSVGDFLDLEIVLALAAGAAFSAPVLPALLAWKGRLLTGAKEWRSLPYAWEALRVGALCVLLGLSTLYLASGAYNPFIYFRF
jgi:alginate O-acetyltransferase complex protein AlgI